MNLTKNPVVIGGVGLAGGLVLFLLLRNNGGSGYALLPPSPGVAGGSYGPSTPSAPGAPAPVDIPAPPPGPSDDFKPNIPQAVSDFIKLPVKLLQQIKLPAPTMPTLTLGPIGTVTIPAPPPSTTSIKPSVQPALMPSVLADALGAADDITENVSDYIKMLPGKGSTVNSGAGFDDDVIADIKTNLVTPVVNTAPTVKQAADTVVTGVKESYEGTVRYVGNIFTK